MHSDYQWILSSPSLMKLPDEMDGALWVQGLLNKHCITFHHFPSISSTPRLGIHYENMVNNILINLLNPIDIKRNIQVKSEKITLGEFDFLAGDKRQGFHIECAIKFYLRVGTGSALSDFVGPQKRDRLDIKWEKMCTKQIKLSETEAGHEVCRQLGIHPTEKKLLIQGFLFHPFLDQSCPNLHPSINPQHNMGWWLRQKEIHRFDPTDQFMPMDKPFWLSAESCFAELVAKSQDDENLNMKEERKQFILSKSQLKEALATTDRPLLVSRGRDINGKWEERDRGFIVGNEW